MGKGAGTCNQRPSLSLVEATEASEREKHPNVLQDWAKQTDQKILADNLHTFHGLQQWVIAERMRELKSGKSRDLGWADWNLEHILDHAPKNASQLYPVFFEDSLLKDGVGYFEVCQERKKQSVKKFQNMSWDPDMPADWKVKGEGVLDHSPYWKDFKNMFSKTAIITQDSFPSAEEIYKTMENKKESNIYWDKTSEEIKNKLCQEFAQALKDNNHQFTKSNEWVTAPDSVWRFHGEVSTEKETELIKQMLRQGATVEDNEMEIPEYDSVHTLNGGKAYKINLETGGFVQYVPHYSVGTKEVVNSDYKVVWHPSEQQLEEIKTKTKTFFENTKAEKLENILVIVREYPNGKKSSEKVVPVSKIPEKFQEQVKEHAQSGETLDIAKGDDKWTEHIRYASQEDLEKCPVYFETSNNKWLFKFHHEKMEKQLAQIDEIGKKDWSWDWEDKDNKAQPRFHKTPSTTEEEAEMKAFAHLDSRIRQTAKQNGWPYGMVRLMTNKDGTLRDTLQSEIKSNKKIEKIPHDAPLSERGCIKVVGASPDDSLKALKRVNAAQKIQKSVPWKMIYEDNSCKGRVNPMLLEYASGEKALKLPQDKFVIHGMTGVSNDKQALERFDKILQTGSLKSIAERRRVGIIANSLSPKGDIASGIDGGVPCTIAASPSFGTHFSFVMKPEILARRDVWFSNTDFGGGHNRYDEYNQYAHSIGQKKLHEPPSDAARQSHYTTGLQSMNEVYLKNEIPWHHIDRIFVADSLYKTVLERVKVAKKEGRLPMSLKIEKSESKNVESWSQPQFLTSAGKSYKDQLKNGIYSG